MQKELELLENKYIELEKINVGLKHLLNEKYDCSIHKLLNSNKKLDIENKYINIKNFNVTNLNNELENENMNLVNFDIDYWVMINENLRFKIDNLKKEIYKVSENIYM